MPTTELLETLLHIERSIGRAENTALRTMIMDAESQVLRIQQEALRLLEELRRAREHQETQLSEGSWHAVAQAIARLDTEKKESRPGSGRGLVDRAS